MEIRYKGIWYKQLAVIPYSLIPYTSIPYKLKILTLWTDTIYSS